MSRFYFILIKRCYTLLHYGGLDEYLWNNCALILTKTVLLLTLAINVAIAHFVDLIHWFHILGDKPTLRLL